MSAKFNISPAGETIIDKKQTPKQEDCSEIAQGRSLRNLMKATTEKIQAMVRISASSDKSGMIYDNYLQKIDSLSYMSKIIRITLTKKHHHRLFHHLQRLKIAQSD